MKRYIFLLGILLLTCTNISAQSTMSDEQVIRFVMKEQKAGSTQQDIAVKLVQKGVTTEQIRRDHPELPAYEEYDELLEAILKAL